MEAISIFMHLALKITQFPSCHILFLKELTESHLVQGRKNRLSLGEVCQSPGRAGGARNVAVPVLGKYNLPQGLRKGKTEDNRGEQERLSRCVLGEEVSRGKITLGCKKPKRGSEESMPRWRLSPERVVGSKEISCPVPQGSFFQGICAGCSLGLMVPGCGGAGERFNWGCRSQRYLVLYQVPDECTGSEKSGPQEKSGKSESYHGHRGQQITSLVIVLC